MAHAHQLLSAHASAIDRLSSSMPNRGCFSAEVTTGGKHVGASSKISFWSTDNAPVPSIVSAFVRTAWSVHPAPPEAWKRASRLCSISLSAPLRPCFALNRM